MKKTLLTISAVALSSSSSMAYCSDINENHQYLKLASISPIIEATGNFVFQDSLYSENGTTPLNPNDPFDPVNIGCVAKGFDVFENCPAADCQEEPCPENPLYKKCSCFCAVNACEEQGYTENVVCGEYDVVEDCPMLPNLGFTKCVEILDYEKCIQDDFLKTKDDCNSNHPIHEKASYCSFDNTYLKCVAMTDAEKCKQDGYVLTSCPSGEVLKDKCTYGNENLYLRCEVDTPVCSSDYVKTCNSGYVLNTSDKCTDTDGDKYKCIADSCTGFDLTSPCSPIDGYVQTTCLSGTTTMYKCVENACAGYSPDPCLKPIDTCKRGTETFYLGCDGGVGDEPLQCQPDGNTWCMTNGFNRQSVWMCDSGEVEENCPCENTKGFKRCVIGETGICNNIICTKPGTGPVDSNGDGCLDVCTPCDPSDNTRICVKDASTPAVYTCSVDYKRSADYNVNTDCYVVPYKMVSEPDKPDCVKCVCDNSSTPGLDCMYK